MIVEELARFFDLPMINSNIAEKKSDKSFPRNSSLDLELINNPIYNEINILEHLHPMFRLNQDLKSGLTNSLESNMELFRTLRTHSKLRDEFKTLSVNDVQAFQRYPSVYKLLMISKGSL
jgi:hypothetical protein